MLQPGKKILIPNFKPRAFFCDMDGTLTSSETLDELARLIGKYEQVEILTRKAMEGQLNFNDSLRERVKILSGVPLDTCRELAEKTKLRTGVSSFIALCLSNDCPVFILTGGFDVFAKEIAGQIKATSFVCNTFGLSANKLSGQVIPPIVDAQWKKQMALKLCLDYGLSPKDCVGIGDGANDRPMLEALGCAIGVFPKPILDDCLHFRLEDGDFGHLKSFFFGAIG